MYPISYAKGMGKMKKTVLIVVVILALAVGVTAYMNGEIWQQRESQQDAYVLIKSGGSEAVS